MNLQTKMPATADEFLRWEGGGDYRWEFVDGQAVRLPRDATRAHVRLVTALALQIFSQADKRRFMVAMSTFAIETPSGVRFPDLAVDRVDGYGDDLKATAPLFIAEVLSAWSRQRDLEEKAKDYAGIPSLLHYLVLSQDEVLGWLWSRGSDGWAGPELLALQEAEVSLAHLGVMIDFRSLYDGLFDRTAN